MFLGYPHGQKGYVLYDLQNGHAFVSRHVTFVETQFPFKQITEDVHNVNDQINAQPHALFDTEDPLLLVSTPPHTDPIQPGVPNDSREVPGDHHLSLESSHNERDDDGLEDHVTIDNARPKRTRQRPKHLADYETDLPSSLGLPSSTSPNHASSSNTSTHHPLCNFVSYDRFSPAHRVFLATIDKHHDPTSFSEAFKHEHWRAAMVREIDALHRNGTWTIEALPPGK